jgi:uncharacterized protein (UPF0332 family)
MMKDVDRLSELCRYRLLQAEQTIAEMETLKNSGHIRGTINRAYYAMFYAIQALVVIKKARISKHSGVISFFDREFVKKGIIDKQFSKWLHRLFDLRQAADYGDMFEPSKKQCEQVSEQVKDFVQRIKEYIENHSRNG